MNRRVLAVLIVSAMPASAQVRLIATPSAMTAPLAVMPSLSFSAPASAVSALTAAPALTALASPSVYAAPALSAPSALAAPALAAAPVAASVAASVATPLGSAKDLGARLADAPSHAAPALAAAFDGKLAAASVPVDAAPSAPLTPEQFASRAESLFTAGRLAPGQRAAVAYRDGVRPHGVLPTDEELRERMARSPLTNPEREQTIVELFKLAGAQDSDIVRQDIGRGKHNFIVTKKGKSDRVIVIGGHHDKVSEGAGTIDNWTGATLVTNLYQALHGADTDATIVFIAFGREEEGLLGSQAYLDSLTPAQKSKIDAMVNLDTLGVDGTYSWKNNSTRALLDRVAKVARDSHLDLKEAHLDGGDADSSSFRQAGIPAVTIYGASMDVIFDIIHSDRDTMAAFDFAHYKNAYLLTLEFLKSLDREKLGPVGRGKV
jgi:hypothetical protein